MDPFSVISGVAGILTAGSALSSALYDLIRSIQDAPREMVEIAGGISELALLLRELKNTLKAGKELYKPRLLRAIRSTTNRIHHLQSEVHDMIEENGSFSRIAWSFRRPKAKDLLAMIESHKSTLQLMATTMLLALKQRPSLEQEYRGADFRGS
jgi:hypothetical protein